GRITRNLSLDRIRRAQAQKRPSNTLQEIFGELEDCAPSADPADRLHLADCFNRFLEQLSPDRRRMFLLRYWYACSIPETARQVGRSRSAVQSALTRIRKELQEFLQKEDITV
ncbi:MAG: RNA polymerase sigma factor, partial [Oscillospiraceae bacterium]|nr:RNA polymerase sigma factor [Oscillospiraceae bacterium]